MYFFLAIVNSKLTLNNLNLKKTLPELSTVNIFIYIEGQQKPI